jgi:hypothetical protein
MHNEPSVAPVTPGEALARLSHIIGTLRRHAHLAQALAPETGQNLQNARQTLTEALEAGEQNLMQNALESAQRAVQSTYEAACQPGIWSAEEAPAHFRLLGFPDPLEEKLQTVDVSTILTTYTQPARQTLTTLTFAEAPGATAYWLRQTRVVQGEDTLDYLIESYSPVFSRVRLKPGRHRFNIESRNPHEQVLSEEFILEIPEPHR